MLTESETHVVSYIRVKIPKNRPLLTFSHSRTLVHFGPNFHTVAP